MSNEENSHTSLSARAIELIFETMGQVIQFRRRVPITKSALARHLLEERERSMAQSKMMMFGAIFTTGIMMIGLAMLAVIN